MASIQNAQLPWREYYALRKRARLSVLALVLVLAFVTGPLLQFVADRLHSVPAWVSIALLYGVDGAAIVLFAWPAVKWAQWRCPRCGKPFVQGTTGRGNVFSVLVRFFLASRCANCGLACGADPQELAADSR